jgi:hypothetical protein
VRRDLYIALFSAIASTMMLRPSRMTKSTSWIKSSLSYANGNCVEVARLAGGDVGLRHSKDRPRRVLRFTQAEWDAFLGGVQNQEFDLANLP